MKKALYIKIPNAMLKDDPDSIKPMAMRMVKRRYKKGYKNFNHTIEIFDIGPDFITDTKTLVLSYDSYKSPRIAFKKI